jgi:hypothetical protein
VGRDKVADDQWNKTFNEGVRQYNEDRAYQKDRDAVLDARDERNYNEDVRRYNQDYDYRKSVDDREYEYKVGRDQVNDARDERNYNEDVRRYNQDYEYRKSVDDRAYEYQVGRDKADDEYRNKTLAEDTRRYNRDFAYNKSLNDRNYNYQKSLNDRDYNYQKSLNDRNFNYQVGRDAVEDDRFERQFAKSSSGGSGGGGGYKTTDDTPKLKTPTSTMFDETLELYNEGGEAALDQYFDSHPGYDRTSIMEYAQNYGDVKDSKSVKDRTWKVTNKGGFNVGWGVDNNAELTDQYGNTFTAKDLKNQLMADGMSEDEANAYLAQFGKDVYSAYPRKK